MRYAPVVKLCLSILIQYHCTTGVKHVAKILAITQLRVLRKPLFFMLTREIEFGGAQKKTLDGDTGHECPLWLLACFRHPSIINFWSSLKEEDILSEKEQLVNRENKKIRI